MAVEIEIKLKVDHLSPIRDRLKELGAQRDIDETLEPNREVFVRDKRPHDLNERIRQNVH